MEPMQLRAYLALLRRFWPLIVALPLLSGGLSLALALGQSERYQTTVQLMLTRSAIDGAGAASLPNLNDSYIWITTEYILDDLPQVVASAAFAEDVRAVGVDASPASIQGALRAEVFHRAVYLSAVADTPELATAIVRGAVGALQSRGLVYWGRGVGGLEVVVINPPLTPGAVGGPRAALVGAALRAALGLGVALVGAALRAALGLGVALGLALLIHYLDDRLRSPAQAEQWTGARVLASIPKE
jgi:capsular polysaccharide biosynthesis protein